MLGRSNSLMRPTLAKNIPYKVATVLNGGLGGRVVSVPASTINL